MIVSFEDIEAAAKRLESVVHHTAVVRSRLLDERLGAKLFLKAENLQRAGSFKIRGAYNTIAQLSDLQKQRGVISYSSGNHAQGVALASQLLGVQATIAVPEDIIATKRAAAAGYGAHLVPAGLTSADRKEKAEQMCREQGLTMIPPYDDRRIIAGQGTVALELLHEVANLDVLVAPIGGGGLMAGCAIAARKLRPGIRIVGVEPAAGNDTALSLQAGERQRIAPPQTIADGLRALEPGELTFPIIQELVDDIVTVPDAAIRQTMRLLLERTKLLVEPSGAVALAALVCGALAAPGRRIGVVLSGGNVALDSLAGILGCHEGGASA